MSYTIVVCLCIPVLVTAAAAFPSCGKGEFYDPVTRTCAPCSDICQNAHIQGTVDRCRTLCPADFTIPPDPQHDEGIDHHTSSMTVTAEYTPPPTIDHDQKTDQKRISTVAIVLIVVAVLVVIAAVLTVHFRDVIKILLRRFFDRCYAPVNDDDDPRPPDDRQQPYYDPDNKDVNLGI